MVGTVPFDFSMDELKEEFGDKLGGKELHFKVCIIPASVLKIQGLSY